MPETLLDFDGSFDWLFAQMNALTSGLIVAHNNTQSGGIEIWPGLDLGYCGPEIFEEVIRPNLKKRMWKNLVRDALGLRGDAAAEYLLENQQKWAQLPDFSADCSDYLLPSIHYVANHYWRRLLDVNHQLANTNPDPFGTKRGGQEKLLADPDCQTALLFIYMRNPWLGPRVLKQLCSVENFSSKFVLSGTLLNLASTETRDIEIAVQFLLKGHLELNQSVGDSATNDPGDIEVLEKRLIELGFIENISTDIEMASLTTALGHISQLVLEGSVTNGQVTPGSWLHYWLCAGNAPRNLTVHSEHLTNQSETVCHWAGYVIKWLAKKQRISAIRSFEEGEAYSMFNLGIHGLSSFGMEFRIALPSSNSEPCLNCTDINFDIDKMEEICRDLLKSEYVLDASQLLLPHAGLKQLGLVSGNGDSGFLGVQLLRPRPISPVFSAIAEEKVEYAENVGDEMSITQSTATQEDLYKYYSSIIQSRSEQEIDFSVKEILYLIGIRGWFNHEKIPRVRNHWTDSIIAIWTDIEGSKVVKSYKATTSPGVFEKFYHAKGDAHLIEGTWRFKRGTHPIRNEKGHEIGRYAALNQAEEFTIWRDSNKDGRREENAYVQTSANLGINLHAGGSGKLVGNWSAGCQVIWGGRGPTTPYGEFMTDVESLTPEGTEILYTLVNSIDLPSINDYFLSIGGGE